MQTLVVLLPLLIAAGPAGAGEAPTREAIALAIGQLGARDFEARQQATELLWSWGPLVAPPLERARQSDDAEVRLRADSILERFRYGVFVHTPEQEVKLITRFRYGDDAVRQATFAQLEREGSVGTLLTLLGTEQDPRLRFEFQRSILRRLEGDGEVLRGLELAEAWRAEYARVDKDDEDGRQQKLAEFMGRQVPYLLARDHLEHVESILRRAASSPQGMADWAIYLQLRGKREAEVAQLREGVDQTANDQRLRQLAYLLRVGGDLAASRSVAERIDDPQDALLRGILFELRDWQALSDLHHKLLVNDPLGYGRDVEALGYAAAFHRLAGERGRFELAVHEIKSLADQQSSIEWSCAEALIVNGLIEDGIHILKRRMTAFAFQLLCAQERYQEAFQLAGIADPPEDNIEWFQVLASQLGGSSFEANRQFELAVQVARVLYQLGERDQVPGCFQVLAGAVQDDRGTARLDKICEVEFQLGLTDLALDHAAASLSKGSTGILGTLFPSHRQAAEIWWEFFSEREAPSSPPQAARTLKHLYRLLVPGGEPLPNVLELVGRAEQLAEQLEGAERGRWLHALGETCWLNGHREQAETYFERSAETVAAAAQRRGELAAARRQWAEAAQWYEQAWRLDRTQALVLYLRGDALVRAGQAEEGQRLMRVAELVPLADSSRRMELARGLERQGLREAAAAQWLLVMRAGRFRVALDGQFRDTWLVDAEKLYANSIVEDLYAKADYWEAMHLSCLEAPLWIPTLRGYLHTPHLIHKTRARARLAEGEIEQALAEIERGRQFMPGNTELAEHLVPELEQAGQQQAADELFDRSFTFVQSLCRQFPKSALHHNNLAWMSARCNRRLDDALRHAERALELAPDSPSYLDTLGEVHFRRGDRQAAIRCAQRCLELEPHNKFFEQQLERFQKAE